MALRDKLRERVQPFLQEGETLEQVFLAQTGPSPYVVGMLGALAMLLMVKRRIVAVTDRNVLVLKAGAMMGTTPKEVLARLPRQTRIGPVDGLWAKIELAGEKAYVHRRFHGDVNAANEAIDGPSGTASGGSGI